MNVDQHLKDRSSIVARVLLEPSFARDSRGYIAGLLCLIGAPTGEAWAAHALQDAGYFARTSDFLLLLVAAGVWLVSAALAADVLIAWRAGPSRNLMVGQVLNQLIKVDGSIMHKHVGGRSE